MISCVKLDFSLSCKALRDDSSLSRIWKKVESEARGTSTVLSPGGGATVLGAYPPASPFGEIASTLFSWSPRLGGPGDEFVLARDRALERPTRYSRVSGDSQQSWGDPSFASTTNVSFGRKDDVLFPISQLPSRRRSGRVCNYSPAKV
jgi:hypothetical protein